MRQRIALHHMHSKSQPSDNNSPTMPAPFPFGTDTGRYVVLFKDEVTRDEINALVLINGFSFPDDKKSYDDSFDDLQCIIGEFDEKSRQILERSKLVDFVHTEYICPAPKAVQDGASMIQYGGAASNWQ